MLKICFNKVSGFKGFAFGLGDSLPPLSAIIPFLVVYPLVCGVIAMITAPQLQSVTVLRQTGAAIPVAAPTNLAGSTGQNQAFVVKAAPAANKVQSKLDVHA